MQRNIGYWAATGLVTIVPLLAAANPDLDLARPLPDDPAWGSIAAGDQPAARAEWAAFQREARAFRAMPARSLLDAVVKTSVANPVRTAANQFLVAMPATSDENFSRRSRSSGNTTRKARWASSSMASQPGS